MVLTPGTRLGPYEIQGPLGKGGMGEVYRARDTRLDRTLAVKVLPPDLAADPSRKARFDREARAVASLNHPHICDLHDIGHERGVDFLVLEYLEAPTLAERLLSGPLPLEAVLRHAAEIADALDHAHRHGVIHRDLKPANIIVTKSGVKLLDFGLARLRPVDSLAAVDTIGGADAPATAVDALLGTLCYMSPEQLAGREADPRTDVFALGAVVYEMTTGRRPFQGETQAATIGAILHAEPSPLARLRPDIPPELDRLVARCLAKDPDFRWQTARDVMLELRWIAGRAVDARPAAVSSTQRVRMRAAVWTAALLAIAGLLLIGTTLLQPSGDQRAVHLALLPPESAAEFSLSPDGRLLAFVAGAARRRIWIQPLDSPAARPLEGTEGAAALFWSPDSRYLAFGADGQLKRIAASGGPAIRLCAARTLIGGTWNRDGVIVFAPDTRTALYRISAAGGEPTPVTALDESQGHNTHRWPHFLPDGRHFLYLARSIDQERNAIHVGSLDSSASSPLMSGNSVAVYASTGHLLFASDGALLAQPFDAGARRLTGEPVRIVGDVRYSSADGFAAFSVSTHGELAYQSSAAGPQSELVWLSRAGGRLDLPVVPGNVVEPSLAPDDSRLAVMEWKNASSDIMQLELPRGGVSRVTFSPSIDFAPIWSPDGRSIVFGTNRGGPSDLYRARADGGSDEVVLASGAVKHATDWSRDGKFLVYQAWDVETDWDLWTAAIGDESSLRPLLRTEFAERLGRLSPDGRWLAYVSNESGRDEVYVRAFPDSARRWLISNAGGTEPRWRRDGRELYYVSADQKLMAVPVDGVGPGFDHGTPEALFEAPMVEDRVWGYDVTADGQRFVVALAVGVSTPAPINLILNWTATLPR